MKPSQLLFRITFVALAILYLAILTEFIDLSMFEVQLDVGHDALGLTLLVIAYVFIFMRKSR